VSFHPLQVFGSRVSAAMPARFVAGFALAIAALNAAAWLAAIVTVWVPETSRTAADLVLRGYGPHGMIRRWR
jgi:hypothetical protein